MIRPALKISLFPLTPACHKVEREKVSRLLMNSILKKVIMYQLSFFDNTMPNVELWNINVLRTNTSIIKILSKLKIKF